MSSGTLGPAQARPAKDAPATPMSKANTAERRVRALAPTVFCPSSNVEQCVQHALERKAS